ncbi:MAG TPA: hypothetical protein VHV83_16860, partial [Armatimonadota bacterium]|nr:hypothetical protein [Armatimonadota bacterium]
MDNKATGWFRAPFVKCYNIVMLCILLFTLLAVCLLAVAPDISTAPPPDLVIPPMVPEAPAPGKRVKQSLSALRGSTLYHALYLPPDWQPDCQYPVIVEYPGNGPYQNAYGDSSSGEVESCVLGYGVT